MAAFVPTAVGAACAVARKKTSDELEYPLYLTLPQMKVMRALTRRTQLAKKVEEAIQKAEGK